jgi:hypothetical protein
MCYFDWFARWRLRSRTPGPPPFSSMNSMPTGFHQGTLTLYSLPVSRRTLASFRKIALALLGLLLQPRANLSPEPNSLRSGKNTGNFVEAAGLVGFCKLIREQNQRLLAVFPAQQNRELFGREQGILAWEQGISADEIRTG